MDKAIEKVKAAGYRPLMWQAYDSSIDGSRFYSFFSERNGSYFLIISDDSEMPPYREPFPETRIYELKPDGKFTQGIIKNLKSIYGYQEL